jgi:hypothetical protein
MKKKKRWLPDWWPKPTPENPFPRPSEEAKMKLGSYAIGTALFIFGIYLLYRFFTEFWPHF